LVWTPRIYPRVLLCVRCHCDASLKSSALRMQVKTLQNTQCQLVFWYYSLPRNKFGHSRTYYFHINRHYLVQSMITALKQN